MTTKQITAQINDLRTNLIPGLGKRMTEQAQAMAATGKSQDEIGAMIGLEIIRIRAAQDLANRLEKLNHPPDKEQRK
jgi:hypothetical protein